VKQGVKLRRRIEDETGFEVVLIRGRSSVRPLSFCTDSVLTGGKQREQRQGVTSPFSLDELFGKACNQMPFPVVFSDIRTNSKMKNVILISTLTLATVAVMAAPLPDPSKLPPASKQEGVTYEKDIHPIFDENCLRCHGDQRPKANLRLDNLEGVLKGSKDGKVVVPGHSEQSGLVFAVSEINGKIAMPPKPRPPRPAAAGATNAPAAPAMTPQAHPWKPLTAEQIGLIRAWIDQGAK
jgi:hypothetical protein